MVNGTPCGLGFGRPTVVTVVGVAAALSTSGSFFHAIFVLSNNSVDDVERVVVKVATGVKDVVGIDVQTFSETECIYSGSSGVTEVGETVIEAVSVLGVVLLVSLDVVWSSSDLVDHVSVEFWPALSAGLDEEVLVLLHVACLRLLAAALERDDVAELLSLLDEAGSRRIRARGARPSAGGDGKRIRGVGGCWVAFSCNDESTSVPKKLEVDLADMALKLGGISLAVTTKDSSISSSTSLSELK